MATSNLMYSSGSSCLPNILQPKKPSQRLGLVHAPQTAVVSAACEPCSSEPVVVSTLTKDQNEPLTRLGLCHLSYEQHERGAAATERAGEQSLSEAGKENVRIGKAMAAAVQTGQFFSAEEECLRLLRKAQEVLEGQRPMLAIIHRQAQPQDRRKDTDRIVRPLFDRRKKDQHPKALLASSDANEQLIAVSQEMRRQGKRRRPLQLPAEDSNGKRALLNLPAPGRPSTKVRGTLDAIASRSARRSYPRRKSRVAETVKGLHTAP